MCTNYSVPTLPGLSDHNNPYPWLGHDKESTFPAIFEWSCSSHYHEKHSHICHLPNTYDLPIQQVHLIYQQEFVHLIRRPNRRPPWDVLITVVHSVNLNSFPCHSTISADDYSIAFEADHNHILVCIIK